VLKPIPSLIENFPPDPPSEPPALFDPDDPPSNAA